MRDGRILVAEDSLVVRAVLREHLAGQGMEVIEAEDGDQAIKLCRETTPDVILLDVEMPGLDGYQVLAMLKTDPRLRDIPVVFLTGRATTEDVVMGLQLGANDYLRKPFEAPELIARVSAAMRIKSLQDQLRQRNEELDLLTRTDPLTGLYNRRHLDEQLRTAASAAVRHGYPLGVLMVDIDNFRNVNDTEGHAAGDTVLAVIASRLRASMRAEDVLGRWGGEEFLALLPYSDLLSTTALAERLRVRVGMDPLVVGERGEMHITISIGCAAGDGQDPEELVREADVYLYLAKESGRNRVLPGPPP